MPIIGITASSNQFIKLSNYFSIATATVTGTAASTIVFDNIPQTYTHLQFRGSITVNNATEWITFTMNDIGGTSYSYHEIRGAGGGTSTASNAINQANGYVALTNSTDTCGFVLDLIDYRNTNIYKTTKSIYGVDSNGGGYTGLVSSNLRTANAITKIVFDLTGTANFQINSKIALYGVL